jgi:saccharopine dehydrogenase-like NADP-dependent oxidoreductase
MGSNRRIAVFGAYGHTGRFVVSELLKRGWTTIISGRNESKLRGMNDAHPELEIRVAAIDNPASLDRAVSGAHAVINCAGPFIDTASPIIEAALRSRIHYLDLTAEQPSAIAAFDKYTEAARDAGIVIAPAMAFYGGLGDLLATAAIGNWASVDEICIAYALDGWKPTLGTRLTGRRNTARRFVFSGNKLEFLADPPPTRKWNFPEPFGTEDVVGITFSEIITISRHLRSPEIHSFMNLTPLKEIRDPETPPPTSVDKDGRSQQIFLVDVLVRRGNAKRRATASGRDIYAITAPIVVEAATVSSAGRPEKPASLPRESSSMRGIF